ncbi:conserved hypothetical protein [Halobacteriovorax marinus SJ]|uniref:Methyltransferase type 11 domain-containing protein n=1 Tax=Halobacteriovorax marinus (strain ATCC BAA-682 / DSM 15412 / SJ) TaxID=862908 RepID=E1X3U7_HALMS|nr:hypothetical protein [Halobacteriovorax marinus]CBW25287.1 conserved hypothetical protein [Halobacteriovorax marinus SJ]
MKLDIGCGNSKRIGYTGVDCLQLENVDVVHDLNVFPYPFEDNAIEEIWMDQVLEHLDSPFDCVNELFRISKAGATIHVGVPYFRSLYSAIDPTHKNLFTAEWFNYFDPDHDYFKKYCYSKSTIRVKNVEFDREWKRPGIKPWHKLMIKFAEKHTRIYEHKLSHLYPLNSLTFHLEVLK